MNKQQEHSKEQENIQDMVTTQDERPWGIS